MTAIFREALGDDFARLHPKMQWRFGFSSADEVAHIGRGVMTEVWRGPAWTLPFLLLGATRRILFPIPRHLRDIPFTIENYAYVDSFGRETVTFARRFRTRRRIRAFDATMIMSHQRGRVVDYLGTHQHLAVELDTAVDERGGLRLRSGAQRFHEGALGFRFPLLLSGVADVCEWWDDSDQQFHIEVVVRNRWFGRLFGYRGSFTVAERACQEQDIPIDVRPVREERRE